MGWAAGLEVSIGVILVPGGFDGDVVECRIACVF